MGRLADRMGVMSYPDVRATHVVEPFEGATHFTFRPDGSRPDPTRRLPACWLGERPRGRVSARSGPAGCRRGDPGERRPAIGPKPPHARAAPLGGRRGRGGGGPARERPPLERPAGGVPTGAAHDDPRRVLP